MPQYISPEEVKWPPQFIGNDGNLLTAGAFDKDEAPFGNGPCLICEQAGFSGITTATGQPSLASHMRDPVHQERRQRVREEYVCFWQELNAPDDRPYYYDHVSDTWSFAKPRCFIVPAGVSEEKSTASNTNDEKLRARLSCALMGALTMDRLVPPGANTVSANGPSFQCDCCQRVFQTEWAAQQHIHSLAGRRGHPVIQNEAVANAAGANRPAALSQALSAEGDIAEADSDGQKYWYNPRTRACAWTRDELVKINREFYAHVTWVQGSSDARGPNGESLWWAWSNGDGTSHANWRLEDLYEKVQQTQQVNTEEKVAAG